MRLIRRVFTNAVFRLTTRVMSRRPDFLIGGYLHPYLLRWWLTPWTRWLREADPGKVTWRGKLDEVLPGAYLHEFWRSDDDRALHDHKWLFNLSLILFGEYTEHTIDAGGIHRKKTYRAGDWRFRWGRAPHRIELADGRCCATLFIFGPKVREWGFHCPEAGWIPWRRFVDAKDAGAVGPGCEG